MPLFHFGSPTCPLDDERKAAIDEQMLWLRAQFGDETLTRATLILPTREFFPRAGERSIEEVEDAFERIRDVMGVPSDAVQLWLYDPEEDFLAEYQQHWESHGAAGLFHVLADRQGPRYLVGVRTDQVTEPGALVAVLAHELAHARLHDRLTGEESQLEHERLTDLATVFFGLGIFTANAILQERKGHNPWAEGAWWSIQRLGYLRGPEFGYALAVYASWRGERRPEWKRYLRKDVEVPLNQALRFFEHSGPGSVPVPPPN